MKKKTKKSESKEGVASKIETLLTDVLQYLNGGSHYIYSFLLHTIPIHL